MRKIGFNSILVRFLFIHDCLSFSMMIVIRVCWGFSFYLWREETICPIIVVFVIFKIHSIIVFDLHWKLIVTSSIIRKTFFFTPKKKQKNMKFECHTNKSKVEKTKKPKKHFLSSLFRFFIFVDNLQYFWATIRAFQVLKLSWSIFVVEFCFWLSFSRRRKLSHGKQRNFTHWISLITLL